jgi:hypothetical protein
MDRDRGSPPLRLDRRLVDQHDRNVIFYGVDAMALLALEGLGGLTIFEPLLAGGADQDFEQILIDHDVVHCTTGTVLPEWVELRFDPELFRRPRQCKIFWQTP